MKQKLLLFLSLLVFGFSTSMAQKHEKSVGGGFDFGTTNSVSLGAKFQYGVTDAIRTEGSLSYYLNNGPATSFAVGVTGHYLFPMIEKLNVYPLFGVSIMHSRFMSISATNFGVNIGGGSEYYFNDNFKANAEIKFQFIGIISQAVFGVGVSYVF